MDQFLKQFRNEVALAFSGLQEAAVAIADHVNQHVQQVKLNLNATELEKEIRSSEVALGKEIYDHPNVRRLGASDQEANVEQLIKQIKTVQRQLEGNSAIVSPHEALHDFERLLIRSEFIIQQIMISDGYHGLGKCIKDLELPSQMLIFFIKKKNEVALAYGGVMIEAQDEVTFLCSKEDVEEYIAFWK